MNSESIFSREALQAAHFRLKSTGFWCTPGAERVKVTDHGFNGARVSRRFMIVMRYQAIRSDQMIFAVCAVVCILYRCNCFLFNSSAEKPSIYFSTASGSHNCVHFLVCN